MPLRVRCAHIFGESAYMAQLFPDRSIELRWSMQDADDESQREIARMDPDRWSLDSAGAIQRRLICLSGICVAIVDGEIETVEALARLVGTDLITEALETTHAQGPKALPHPDLPAPCRPPDPVPSQSPVSPVVHSGPPEPLAFASRLRRAGDRPDSLSLGHG
jgi:hypothetical protein